MSENLTDVVHWESMQGHPTLELAETDLIYQWVQNEFSSLKIDGQIHDCFEIGCYPGRYLGMMARRGFRVSGLDYIDAVRDVPRLIEAAGGTTGDFFCMSIREFEPKNRYDLVFSLGFIEHFSDWTVMFQKHIDMINPGGFLLVEVPNYRGLFQRLPRLLFDYKNYKRHNLDSMNLNAWRRIAEQSGLEVLKAEAIGGYGLWFIRKAGPTEQRARSLLVGVLRMLQRVVFRHSQDHPWFSSALIFLARKPKPGAE